MTLFSDPISHYSHRVRIVLAEKGISVDIEEYSPSTAPIELADVNPYNSLPTLLDRDLVLYKSTVIMEYLDERFPHPPLLPVYPVARAQSRLWMYRIERDWSPLVDQILAGEGDIDAARKSLQDSILAVAPIFEEKPYFMSDDFTVVDCLVGPILWRVKQLGIEIPDSFKGVHNYMIRIFDRESFQASLSEAEREMRL